jgi:small subunit ribosomal protein S17
MKPVVGIVVSNKMQKSVVVAVDRLFHNKVYNRYVKRTSKFMAHDEADECNIGDRVSSPRAIDLSRPRLLPFKCCISAHCVLVRFSWCRYIIGSSHCDPWLYLYGWIWIVVYSN